PRFPYFAAQQLATQEIIDADPVFTQNLKTNPAGSIPLVAKFGTGALSSLVQSIYSSKVWPCSEEAWFVAYLIRVLPAAQGKAILEEALERRSDRGCFRSLLGTVSRIVWNPVIEHQAMLSLHDTDPETAENAARALSRSGGAQVESSLWQRLEQWSNTWNHA